MIWKRPQGLIFCSIFYILYIANLFWILFTLYQDEERLEKLMMVMMAGTCNLAMLLSPIYGPRSSLYTVYFIILLTASVASKIKISSAEAAVILICCSGMCLQRSLSWKRIYTQVAQVQSEPEPFCSIIANIRRMMKPGSRGCRKKAFIPRTLRKAILIIRIVSENIMVCRKRQN